MVVARNGVEEEVEEWDNERRSVLKGFERERKGLFEEEYALKANRE